MRHIDGPVTAGERIYLLDVVRGVALLGILIMNMPGFANSFFVQADGSYLWDSPLDRTAETLRDMLFSGKFNSMFSLLFGIGFTLQFARLQERHPGRAGVLYLRRLAFLLALGLLHGMVFWTGDILHLYALFGIALLLVLRHASDRVIAALIALGLLYPAVSGSARLLLVTPAVTTQQVSKAQLWEASNNLAYGSGSFLDAAREHAREFVFGYTDPWALWPNLGFAVQIGTVMLLGVLVGRHRLAQRAAQFMPWVKRLQWASLAVGLAGAAIFGVVMHVERAPGPSVLKIVGSVSYAWCRVAMMIFYVMSIVRLLQQPAWAARGAPFAAAGRLPLTNYLMQTAICTTLFYGWGFGLWGKVGPAAQLALALAIFFLVQVPLSILWLRRFETGPLEYLWRVATYGRSAAGRVAAA